MSYAEALKQFRNFMESLRGNGYNLGLEPEFSVIESFVLKEGEGKFIYFRENLDRFWENRRGLMILEKLRDKAAKQGLPLVVQGLDELLTETEKLFSGQFLYYPPDKFTSLPHPAMIKTIGQMANDNEIDKIEQFIDQNIIEFDGHFFVTLGATLRNARSAGVDYTVEFYELIGGMVAKKRLQANLPCSFAYLYGIK